MTSQSKAESLPTFSAGELLRWQEAGCRINDASPFYAEMFGRFAHDCEHGDSPIVALLQRAPMTINAAPPLRLFGGLHRSVLQGELPNLQAAWPTPEAPLGDVDGAYSSMVEAFVDPSTTLIETMDHDPQTNEVGRSAGLALGLAMIAARIQGPIRLFEIGASAGLNLRIDHYRCETGDWSWGNPRSAVRFGPDSYIGTPMFDGISTEQPMIVERRGCDIHPIDATTDDGATTLASYVWPDQFARHARLNAALAIAREAPVIVDAASADDWVDEHVRPVAGAITVVMHSVMWQYMPPEVQARTSAIITERGQRAPIDAPIVELAMEPTPHTIDMRLSFTEWPSGETIQYAQCGGHGPPVTIF